MRGQSLRLQRTLIEETLAGDGNFGVGERKLLLRPLQTSKPA
jgi:hypothetical protein